MLFIKLRSGHNFSNFVPIYSQVDVCRGIDSPHFVKEGYDSENNPAFFATIPDGIPENPPSVDIDLHGNS